MPSENKFLGEGGKVWGLIIDFVIMNGGLCWMTGYVNIQ